MRHDEPRLVDTSIPVEDQIQIERPRGASGTGALAPEVPLDREQTARAGDARRPWSPDDGAVQETGGCGPTPTAAVSCNDETRRSLNERGERLDRRREAIAFAIAEVAAQRERDGHPRPGCSCRRLLQPAGGQHAA